MAKISVQMAFVPGINYGESTDICQGRGFGTLRFSKASDYTQPKSKGNLCLFYLSPLGFSLPSFLLINTLFILPEKSLLLQNIVPGFPDSHCLFFLNLYPELICLFPAPPCVMVVVHNHTQISLRGKERNRCGSDPQNPNRMANPEQ